MRLLVDAVARHVEAGRGPRARRRRGAPGTCGAGTAGSRGGRRRRGRPSSRRRPACSSARSDAGDSPSSSTHTQIDQIVYGSNARGRPPRRPPPAPRRSEPENTSTLLPMTFAYCSVTTQPSPAAPAAASALGPSAPTYTGVRASVSTYRSSLWRRRIGFVRAAPRVVDLLAVEQRAALQGVVAHPPGGQARQPEDRAAGEAGAEAEERAARRDLVHRRDRASPPSARCAAPGSPGTCRPARRSVACAVSPSADERIARRAAASRRSPRSRSRAPRRTARRPSCPRSP